MVVSCMAALTMYAKFLIYACQKIDLDLSSITTYELHRKPLSYKRGIFTKAFKKFLRTVINGI